MHDTPSRAPSRSDEELVEFANAGELWAFDELYLRHRAWAWALARRFLRNEAEAEDVLQDAFTHLWTRFPGFVLRARLRTFLYPVIRHLAMERGRRAMRARELGPGHDEVEAGPDIQAPGTVRDELATALATLPSAQREVVLMRFVDDLELAEIAQALELPLGTVKSRLHHAIKALREDPGTRAALL